MVFFLVVFSLRSLRKVRETFRGRLRLPAELRHGVAPPCTILRLEPTASRLVRFGLPIRPWCTVHAFPGVILDPGKARTGGATRLREVFNFFIFSFFLFYISRYDLATKKLMFLDELYYEFIHEDDFFLCQPKAN